MQFSVPYIDQPLSFWEGIKGKYGTSIKEVYFPLPHHTIGTGRPLQPERHLYDFLESRMFPASVLINPVVLPDSADTLFEGISASVQLLTNHCNLKGATLANLFLAKYLKKEFPALELTASVLMDVFTSRQAMLLNTTFDNLVPSSRIVRNLPALNKIKASFQGKIRLIVNESCLPDCLFRTQHFYEMSDRRIKYPKSLCNDTLLEFPWLVLTGSWILPQHLYFFEGVYDEIKLAGRVSLNSSDQFIKVLDSYINRTFLSPDRIGGGPASVTFPIEIADSFYETTLLCDKNCLNCDFCSKYYHLHSREFLHEEV